MVLALGARLLPGPRTIDDAYITFRYARNLLDGHGLVYNVGEAVLGTTTPAYAVLLSVVASPLGGVEAPFPEIAWAFNALIDPISCLLLILIGAHLGYHRSGIAAALVWAVAPWSVTFSIGGMETSLLVTLMLGTFYLYLSERPIWAALVASVGVLTRPDSLIYLAPIGISRLFSLHPRYRQQYGLRWQEALVFAVPLAVWSYFGFTTYGNPLPHSIFAKVAAYHLPAVAGLERLIQHYSTPFLGHLTFGGWWIAAGLLLFPTLFGLGAIRSVREAPKNWWLWVYPWLYLTIFAIANPLIFRWYLTPPLPVLFLGIFVGVERVGRDLGRHSSVWLPAGAAFLLTLNGWSARPDHGPARPAPEMAFIQLELLYQRVALHELEPLSAGQTLAAGDIGALGYFTRARMLDTVGLISPDSLKYYPLPQDAYAINYAIPEDLILDLEPDQFVMLEAYGRNTLLKNNEFLKRYSLVTVLDTEIYGSEGMLIYRRSR
jgi:hypothetical protein